MSKEIPLPHSVSYSIPKASESVGLSRPSIYKEINTGRLKSFMVGSRRFISHQALIDWIKAREAETGSDTSKASA